jgi:DNA-binding Lrp family transcriptional regulator
MAVEIDEVDRAILRIVQRDTRRSAEAIGEEIGASAASVHRRLRRLREAGVIEREVAVLNGKALGKGLTILVTIVMEREHKDIMDAFGARMRAHPNVQQCYLITGEADFLIVVKVGDMDEFEEFCDVAFADRENFRKFNTSIVMNHVKTGCEVQV